MTFFDVIPTTMHESVEMTFYGRLLRLGRDTFMGRGDVNSQL